MPRKKHEIIHQADSAALKEIKIKKTLHNVESEIEELLYHKSIHENKVSSIDTKAMSLIDSISNEEVRNKTRDKWFFLVKAGEASVQKSWLKKRTFIESDKHLIVLGSSVKAIRAK